MVGRHVHAAPGEAYAPERLKPGGHHLLSRQRCGTVSTFERRRKETRERKALQGIGRPESAAFSERLDFRATTQGQARLTKACPKTICSAHFVASLCRTLCRTVLFLAIFDKVGRQSESTKVPHAFRGTSFY